MQLVLSDNLALVREKYIEVIEHTKDMNIHARWIYGQHPTDTTIQSYIDRQEMYLYMDGIKTVFCDSLCDIRQCALKKGVATCGDCPDIDNCQAVATIISTNPEALKNLRG